MQLPSLRLTTILKIFASVALCAGGLIVCRRAIPPSGSHDTCVRLLSFGTLADLTRQSISSLLTLESIQPNSPRELKKTREIDSELRQLHQTATSAKQIQTIEWLSRWSSRIKACGLLDGMPRQACLTREGEAEIDGIMLTVAVSGLSETCNEAEISPFH